MDLIFSLFQAYSVINDATKVYENVSDWVVEIVNTWSRRKTSETIQGQVATIATATESDIRLAATRAFAKNPKSIIPEAKREELIGVLINMARNVRAQTSYGSLSSDGSFLRSERLLDQLLHDVEPVRHVNEPVAPGSPWILKRHLGMGSFGEVWLARNPGYPIPRAYKFFTKDGSGEWLRREQSSLVAILERLRQHDQVVHFEDVQVDKCDYPYLAFEYMGGGSLEEWILKDVKDRPRLETSEIVRQVTSGLAATHAKRIYHRDIKPANILLTGGDDPQIKIGDFGLAKITSTSLIRVEASQGSLGGTTGTSLYLPPEAQQRSFKRKPAQDDVFAVGVVWFQLIVGAIERPSYDFAVRLAERGADSHTIRLIERCLAHPDRRYKDAGELLDRLGDGVPEPKPTVAGIPDVQHIAREYLAMTLINQS